ncbi:MAG TPA: glycosyl hydrolase, partial [Blastocatellia bacterium]|nr:glycosyl hydrolase [Blastocatellia bacterium]
MKMSRVRRSSLLILLAALVISSFASPSTTHAQQRGYDPSLLKGLQWRSIGPYRGGRATAVAGVTSQPNVFYFGSTGGGVWKTTDGGINWDNVSDEYFKTGSVGAIGVAESDPNVVYVGMGESPIRGNVSHG